MPIATWIENGESEAPIKIHQDINAYATFLAAGKSLPFEVRADRQAYLVVAEGKVRVDGIGLHARDAIEIRSQDVTVEALDDAHVVVIEMPLSEG
jgi:redox-sensitive bicupin YhaK (pirin superfamily)